MPESGPSPEVFPGIGRGYEKALGDRENPE